MDFLPIGVSIFGTSPALEVAGWLFFNALFLVAMIDGRLLQLALWLVFQDLT